MSATDWRCDCCGRLLARVHLAPGSSVTVKCVKCGTVHQLRMPLPATSSAGAR